MKKIVYIAMFLGIFDIGSAVAFALQISEVLPNPKGNDIGREWIELYNDEPHEIDLKGWRIQNKKKAYLSGKIKAGEYLVLRNLKTTLKNSNEEILLIDANGKRVDEVAYVKSKNGLSLSRVLLQRKTQNMWTQPSPGKANPKYYEFEGEIIIEPQIGKDFYFVMNENGMEHEISFEEEQFEFNTMLAVLKISTSLKALVEEKNDKYLLKDYKVIAKGVSKAISPAKPPVPSTTKTAYTKYILIISGLLLTIYMLKKTKTQP